MALETCLNKQAIFSSVTELSIRVPVRDIVLGDFNSYIVSIEHTIY